MKIEQILYGMQTSNGKIALMKSAGVNNLLTFANIEYIRKLTPEDSYRYLWFKTEQTLAYPVVVNVQDKDPKHGGRTWVQNHTCLVNVHDFISHVQAGGNPFINFKDAYLGELTKFPDRLETLTV